MNTNTARSVGLVAAGALIGGGVVYLGLNTKLRKEFADFADQEIAEVKETYKLLRKEPPYDDPKTAVAAYNDRLGELGYMHEHGVEAETVEGVTDEGAEEEPEEDTEVVAEPYSPILVDNKPQVLNIFDQEGVYDKPSESADVMKWERSEHKPYIITVGEFMDEKIGDEGDEDFDKLTLTYFEEDDTLVDERQSPIPEVEKLVTRFALSHFGDGSEDENIVYVRNHHIQTDFEICLEQTSYAKTVLGVDNWDEVRVAVPKGKFKTRGEDE